MKATGIVRRIDDLGRVVIPKEIRRTLRIREGDPLEIFTDREGEVILKKYSPIGELSDFAKEYAETLAATSGHLVVICDKDLVIAVSGGPKRDYMDKAISADLDKAIRERRAVTTAKGGTMLAITAEDEANYPAQVVAPIISQGDAIGAVVLLSTKEGAAMDNTELKLAQTAAGFLGSQMLQ